MSKLRNHLLAASPVRLNFEFDLGIDGYPEKIVTLTNTSWQNVYLREVAVHGNFHIVGEVKKMIAPNEQVNVTLVPDNGSLEDKVGEIVFDGGEFGLVRVGLKQEGNINSLSDIEQNQYDIGAAVAAAEAAATAADAANVSTQQIYVDVQNLINGQTIGDMFGANNLSELTNTPQARTNLSVYSIAEIDTALSGLSYGDVVASNNLSELTDYVAARTNLDVYSTTEVDDLIGSGSGVESDEPIQWYHYQSVYGGTLDYSAGAPAQDDVGLAIIGYPQGNRDFSMTNWTELEDIYQYNAQNGKGVNAELFIRTLANGEQNVTVGNGGVDAGGVMIFFRDVDPTTPLDVPVQSTYAFTGQVMPPPIEPVTGGAIIVCLFTLDGFVDITEPVGVDNWFTFKKTAGGFTSTHACYSIVWDGDGPVQPPALPISGQYGAYSVALKPRVAGQLPGDMRSSNNLSDVADVIAARANLGLNVTYVSDTAPALPVANDLWWDSEEGRLKIRYNDGTSQQWVDATPAIDSAAIPQEASASDILVGSATDKYVSPDKFRTATAPVALVDAATIAVDFEAGRNFTVTLTNNRILGNPTNVQAGDSGTIYVIQDGTGSRTLTLGSNWKLVGTEAAPTLSAEGGTVDVFAYFARSSTAITLSYVGSEYQPAPATLGTTEGEDTFVAGAANEEHLYRVNLASAMEVQGLVAKLYASAANSGGTFRLTLRADAAGSPGNLLAVTGEKTEAGVGAGNTVDLNVTPVTLSAGDYWLGIHMGTEACEIAAKTTGALKRGKLSDTFSDGTNTTASGFTDFGGTISLLISARGVAA